MAQHKVKILIVEPSLIIRSGVVAVLSKFERLKVSVAELDDLFALPGEVASFNPDIVVVNPQYMGMMLSPRDSLRTAKPIKFVALHNASVGGGELLRNYDAIISIFDSGESIEQTLLNLMGREPVKEVRLSQREREIVKSITKGMSNKEIAERLSISANTVITHRRNIAAKLEIHNPAALTIYAIANGLIEIGE